MAATRSLSEAPFLLLVGHRVVAKTKPGSTPSEFNLQEHHILAHNAMFLIRKYTSKEDGCRSPSISTCNVNRKHRFLSLQKKQQLAGCQFKIDNETKTNTKTKFKPKSHTHHHSTHCTWHTQRKHCMHLSQFLKAKGHERNMCKCCFHIPTRIN